MNLITRSDIVLVWKNKKSDKISCVYCRLRRKISEVLDEVEETNGMCPIESYLCHDTNGGSSQIKTFNNETDTILATVFECNAKCGRFCEDCAVNKLILFIEIHKDKLL